jgi:hypothetical protein
MNHSPLTIAGCAWGNRVEDTARAIVITRERMPFECGAVLFSSHKPDTAVPWCQVRVSSIQDYNRFILFDLYNYVRASHCLIVQWDGFALHPELWDDAFLGCDFIGAPVPPWGSRKSFFSKVANGGFSLRSRRWLQTQAALRHQYDGYPEDQWCAVNHRRDFERAGLKIAPLGLAIRFAFQQFIPAFPGWSLHQSFGFHGRWHLKPTGQ